MGESSLSSLGIVCKNWIWSDIFVHITETHWYEEVLTVRKEAVGVFYSPSWLGKRNCWRDKIVYIKLFNRKMTGRQNIKQTNCQTQFYSVIYLRGCMCVWFKNLLIGLVLRHINHFRLFNAKFSLYIYIYIYNS